MKKQNIFLLAMLAVLTLAACEKYTGTTSSNLVGTWDIYSMTQNTYTNGILDSTDVQNDLGTLTFDADGSGTYSVSNGEESSSGSFDYFEKNDKVFINMINLSDSVMTKNFAIGFDVKTNTATQQVWSITVSYYQDEDLPSGATVKQLKKSYMEMDLRKQ